MRVGEEEEEDGEEEEEEGGAGPVVVVVGGESACCMMLLLVKFSAFSLLVGLRTGREGREGCSNKEAECGRAISG